MWTGPTGKSKTLTREGDPAEQIPDSFLASMVSKGLITPAVSPNAPLPTRQPVAPLEVLLAELAADREDPP